MYTLIQTAKLNDIDPQAWLADVLARHRRRATDETRPAPALELDPRTHPPKSRLTAAYAGGLRKTGHPGGLSLDSTPKKALEAGV